MVKHEQADTASPQQNRTTRRDALDKTDLLIIAFCEVLLLSSPLPAVTNKFPKSVE
jgi:hypothetical protein